VQRELGVGVHARPCPDPLTIPSKQLPWLRTMVSQRVERRSSLITLSARPPVDASPPIDTFVLYYATFFNDLGPKNPGANSMSENQRMSWI